MDGPREDDTTHLSASSSGLSDSATGSEILFTILSDPPVGPAKWPANLIPLLAKLLTKQNRQPPLNVLHHLVQSEDDTIKGVQFDDDYRMQDTPEKRYLNYLIKQYQRSDERGKCHAGFDPKRTQDPSLRECVWVLVRRT